VPPYAVGIAQADPELLNQRIYWMDVLGPELI
jgi:hypothetical protein